MNIYERVWKMDNKTLIREHKQQREMIKAGWGNKIYFKALHTVASNRGLGFWSYAR